MASQQQSSGRRRTSLVTGANTGIGRATAAALANRGDRVVFACRSAAKTAPVMQELAANTGNDQLEFLELDLADLAAVGRAASEANERFESLDVFVANAGVAGLRGQTEQRFELAFGVNHLGHFLFITELMGQLLSASETPENRGPARLVVVSSGSHHDAKGIDFGQLRGATRSVTGLPEYAVSKLANVLFTQEVARRFPPEELFAVALHPGNLIATDILRRVPGPIASLINRFRPSAAEGARTSVMCATSDEALAHHGGYYSMGVREDPSPVATVELAAELWQRSDEWVAPFRPGPADE